MAKSKTPADVSIGKIDILATYTYAKALLGGLPADEAKVRGLVAAIMGAQVRAGAPSHGRGRDDEFRADRERAERKKKTTITTEAFDRRVAGRMGDFFDRILLPAIEELVKVGRFYEEVKEAVGISSRWGAKISGDRFQEAVSAALRR
jgi:hypothetical protein